MRNNNVYNIQSEPKGCLFFLFSIFLKNFKYLEGPRVLIPTGFQSAQMSKFK